MAVAVANIKRYDVFGGIVQTCTLTFSGSYTTGGDTVDLSGKVPTAKAPIFALVAGIAGFPYQWVVGTTLANGKVMVRINDAGGANAPNAEHSAAGYAAGVTGDTVKAIFFFPGI